VGEIGNLNFETGTGSQFIPPAKKFVNERIHIRCYTDGWQPMCVGSDKKTLASHSACFSPKNENERIYFRCYRNGWQPTGGGSGGKNFLSAYRVLQSEKLE